MPKYVFKRWHGLHIIVIMVLLLMMSSTLLAYQLMLGTICMVLSGLSLILIILAEIRFRKDLRAYIESISYRVKRAGNEVVDVLPIGIILFNEEQKIEWGNPYISKMLNMETVIGELLTDVIPGLKNNNEKMDKLEITIDKQTYQVWIKPEERIIYFSEITEFKNLLHKYEDERPTIGILMLDNIDEATQGIDDQMRNQLLAKVTAEITEWAQKNQLLLRRTSSDKYLILCPYKTLRQLEQTRFEILDEVRELTIQNKIPLTLSMGFATHFEGWVELGQMSQMSLDMSLGRGGDQVTVKTGPKLNFYGGRSNATEKRTRVRARVIAHALRDLIKESDHVMIMGHLVPDMDSLGAAIGLWKAVSLSEKEVNIVIEGINPSIEKLMKHVNNDNRIQKSLITPAQAEQIVTTRSLVIVVDTHKASMVVEPNLLKLTSRIVVIDHHRKSEDFISDATLVYIEPYASSTSELVTELLQYIHDRVELNMIESTALLAGIIIDTKSFSVQTGARTFEAASFLRRHGADTGLIQEMLKEDLESYIEKAEIVKHTKIIYDHIALVVAQPNQKYSQLTIAQIADTLLNLTHIKASFVISERKDNFISISARSVGQINVQLIMERLGGGGHLTNAATQLQCSIEEATKKLMMVLQEIEEQEGLFE